MSALPMFLFSYALALLNKNLLKIVVFFWILDCCNNCMDAVISRECFKWRVKKIRWIRSKPQLIGIGDIQQLRPLRPFNHLIIAKKNYVFYWKYDWGTVLKGTLFCCAYLVMFTHLANFTRKEKWKLTLNVTL